MKPLLVKLGKIIGYSIAILIILTALLVSISRLITPVLNNHRVEFEAWASEFLQTPVHIDDIRVTWYRYQPQITLDNVTLVNKETHKPTIKVQQIRVFFSIINSLWQWKPVLSIINIKGVDVSLYELPNGEIAIQGFSILDDPNAALLPEASKSKNIVKWLTAQPHLILENIGLAYTPLDKKKKGFALTIKNFNLANKDDKHVLSGQVLLHQTLPTALTLTAHWHGDITEPAKVRGRFYVYLTGISMPQWLHDQVVEGWELKQGLANAKIWASWDKGGWQKIQSSFTLHDVLLYSQTDNTLHPINRISGNVGWKKQGQYYLLAGDELLVDLPSRLWPVSNFSVVLAPQQDHLSVRALQIGYMDLGDMQSFLLSTEVLSPEQRELLAKLRVEGEVLNLIATLPKEGSNFTNANIQATIKDVNFSSHNNLPGVAHLSGQLQWRNAKGVFSIDSKQLIFNAPNVFANSLIFSKVKGDIQTELKPDGAWQFSVNPLRITNQDVGANIAGSFSLSPDGSPSSDLTADFSLKRANRVTQYLPLHTFDKDLVQWLEAAFLSGSLKSGQAILKGHLVDFPFDKNNGKFLIRGDVVDLNFRYAPEWPLVQHMNGSLVFEGNGMRAKILSAETMGMPLLPFSGVISNLGGEQESILDITGGASAGLTQALNFIHHSPLQKTIGKSFADAELTGRMGLKLDLTIPLSNPDLTKVKGDVELVGANFSAAPWHILLENLNGKFHFTEDSVHSDPIIGTLFNKTSVLTLNTVNTNKNTSFVRASLTGTLNIADLHAIAGKALTDVAAGETQYKADIDLNADAPLRAVLRSNLKGVSLKLPEPYAKKAEEEKELIVNLIAEDPLLVRLDYANALSAAVSLRKVPAGFKFMGGEIHIGKGIANWPTAPGWYLVGIFDQLKWEEVQGYLQPTTGASKAISLDELRGINIEARGVAIASQHLRQVKVEITPDAQNWNVAINSEEMKGKIQIPKKLSAKSRVNGQFQRLYLQSSTNKSNSDVNPSNVPAISLTVDDIRYDKSQLGKLILQTAPTAGGLAIKDFHLTSPYMDLQATGSWLGSATKSKSSLMGRMKTSQASNLLGQWGVDSSNAILSKGEIDFNLNWANSPHNISLSNLIGKVNINLGKGRLLESEGGSEAKMGIGRMLSLFSLQTLPRRLTFDFSDLFEKGYSFDFMRGSFSLKGGGDAYTDDTIFDGPVARIRVAGRIGLVKKDYDMLIGVTPYVTSSIPIAATLLTANPVIGVAAWVVNKVISSEVLSKVVTYNYKATGTWTNPVWQPISTHAEPVAATPAPVQKSN